MQVCMPALQVYARGGQPSGSFGLSVQSSPILPWCPGDCFWSVSPHKNEGGSCRETRHWDADQLSQHNRHRMSETASRRNFRDTGIEFTHDLLLVYQAVNSAAHTLIAEKIYERAAAGRYEWRFAMKY